LNKYASQQLTHHEFSLFTTTVLVQKPFTVNRYNAVTKKHELIFECTYENNEDWNLLYLFFDDKKVTYFYNTTSSGEMIQFFDGTE